MKLKKYIKLREDFLEQYDNLPKNELGFVRLEMFSIPNINRFLTLFALDYKGARFNNTVKSVGVKQFFIGGRAVTFIKLNDKKSFLDKYPEVYPQWVKYYFS